MMFWPPANGYRLDTASLFDGLPTGRRSLNQLTLRERAMPIYAYLKHGILAPLFLATALATSTAAQDDSEDGVLRSCFAKDKGAEVCICASLVLHARLGDDPYARFGEIEDRLAEIAGGAEASEDEMNALTAEGYRFFLPHGQAISVCEKKISGGE